MFKLIIAVGLLFSNFVFAAADDHIMITPSEIKWAKGPGFLPAGAEAAVLFGDPGAAGPFAIRLKFPDKYKVPMHFHSTDENVVVISGELMMGGHDTSVALKSLPAGSFAHMKAGVHHQVEASGETVVQVNAMGPFDITYINPDDDPRN